MLTNYLFGSWGGDDTVGSHPRRLSELIHDEEEKDLEGQVQNDDELADRLLTQFPVYGTYRAQSPQDAADWLQDEDRPQLNGSQIDSGSNHHHNNNHNGGNLLHDRDPLPTLASLERRLMNRNTHLLASPAHAQHSTASPVSPTTPTSPTKQNNLAVLPAINNDWDYDEQCLWQAVGKEDEQITNASRQNRYSGNNNNTINGGLYLTYHQQQQKRPRDESLQGQPKPQQQWIYGKNNNNHQIQHENFSDDPLSFVTTTNGSQIPSQQQSQQQQEQQQLNVLPNDNANNTNSSAQDFYNSKQHWMPDQLCKQCYKCEVQFNVFRRRHHCRLCGQVFCSACSAYFVPSQKKGTTLRTCEMCYNQVDGDKKRELLLEKESENAENENDDTDDSNQNKRAGDTDSPHKKSEVKEGRPVVSNHKSLTIQTSPSNLKSTSPTKDSARSDAKSLSDTLDPKDGNSVWMDGQDAPKKTEWPTTKDLGVSASSQEGRRHLGLTAARHLEQIGASLLEKDAPLLMQEIAAKHGDRAKEVKQWWLDKLMTLATRCCATVKPNVKMGDMMDIRPYVKIKVIPGGFLKDSAYISGIIFRRNVSHKRMAKEVLNPRILLVAGNIEFKRGKEEDKWHSLHTLSAQEEAHMELLSKRFLSFKPDIICVGGSVSVLALEHFVKANVIVIQHVKPVVMERICRQTGAQVIQDMRSFKPPPNDVRGKCNRFRLVAFRDNEVWIDALDRDSDIYDNSSSATNGQQKSIRVLLKDLELPNHERQAALAANLMGDRVLDGAEAIKAGLAKRGVAHTYVMLEGCPKHLGCSIVLQGASRAALKQVKRVFRFLLSVAYNLNLEMSFLKERCARIRPDFRLEPKHVFSSSLCVDYGSPPPGRKVVRPWNGGNNEVSQRSLSGEITTFDHQSILITSVWMTQKTLCCPAEVKGICYYSLQDVSLGQFLQDSCFNLDLRCQNPNCDKNVNDHNLLFVHKDGVLKISVEKMDNDLPPPPQADGSRTKAKASPVKKGKGDDKENKKFRPIATWTYCKKCAMVVTPLTYISENTWKLSFGKFLEIFFYNRDAIMNSPEYRCSCPVQMGTLLYFGCGELAARFSYERVHPLGVYVRKTLPIDTAYHKKAALQELEKISISSSKLFVKFDTHLKKVGKEARSLFGSAALNPTHLQTVLSELNRIGSEVDHAALTLQEKIASVLDKCRRDGEGVVNEAFFRFPWSSRRYTFQLTAAWNERLSATGQAIVAMKKLASSASLRGDSVIGPNGPLTGTEELMDAMRRLRQLNDVYSTYNVSDITTAFPTVPGKQEEEFEDDDFDGVDASIDFADGVDADVLASRRRLNNSKSVGTGTPFSARGQLHKTLGTQRSFDSSHLQQETASTSQPRVTPGAVKSAITRFFNRGGRESDPYQVDLGIFKEGRMRLNVGVNAIVVPVVDEQLSTVIAYSLASEEYAKQFKSFSKMENTQTEMKPPTPEEPQTVDQTTQLSSPSSASNRTIGTQNEKKSIEQRMLVRHKSHIKHTFREFDEKGMVLCKFVCTTFWACQFAAVRQIFLSQATGRKDGPSGGTPDVQPSMDIEQGYVQSLSEAVSWAASGGKSGASFAKTADDRFIIKCISRTELQMFLDCAPAYFEYLSKAFFHGLPTVLCKIVGVYQIGYHNRETGKRTMEQVAVMQNIFYNRKISRVFDLKGSLKGRFAAHLQTSKETRADPSFSTEAGVSSGNQGKDLSDVDNLSRHGDKTAQSDRSDAGETQSGNTRVVPSSSGTLLDGDFLAWTRGRPMPLTDRAKNLFHMSIQNDTLFLSIINVLDYSILVGIDEENMELVVGIIDFMRQYDILKQMERVGKSLPMVVGSEAPTIIQPPLYKTRFTNAMERYFMTVPCKWTTI